MLSSIMVALFLAAGLGDGIPAAGAQPALLAVQMPDTATVRLHISRMTCGTCPTTARLALKRLPGVYRATVTLEDSLGIVRYDPRRVTPDQIASQLTRLTGFGARVLSDTDQSPRKRGGE